MKYRIKNTLRGLAKHFGLKVKFVCYLKDDVHGKLLPREKRILINAHKPRHEHVFTLLHEIGHFLMHFKSLPRKHHPRFFDIHWKTEWLANLCSKVRRYFRYIFSKESGKEWEADLWAMCAFVYLAKHLGCRDELRAFVNRHPEKANLFRLVEVAVVYGDTKTRIQKAYHLIRSAEA
jgi:hypothetical protein